MYLALAPKSNAAYGASAPPWPPPSAPARSSRRTHPERADAADEVRLRRGLRLRPRRRGWLFGKDYFPPEVPRKSCFYAGDRDSRTTCAKGFCLFAAQRARKVESRMRSRQSRPAGKRTIAARANNLIQLVYVSSAEPTASPQDDLDAIASSSARHNTTEGHHRPAPAPGRRLLRHAGRTRAARPAAHGGDHPRPAPLPLSACCARPASPPANSTTGASDRSRTDGQGGRAGRAAASWSLARRLPLTSTRLTRSRDIILRKSFFVGFETNIPGGNACAVSDARHPQSVPGRVRR